MTAMTLPDEPACMALLHKYDTPDHIVFHSKKVWAVGKLLADGLSRNGRPIDTALLRAACLLHDIAKYPCILDGKAWHDRRGEEMLIEEGLPLVGRVVGQHVMLKDFDGVSIREEHVLYYADKRVVHDKVVSLEARFRYLEETYGKTPKAVEGLAWIENKTFRLEEKIFRFLDFEPEDVPNLIE